MVSFFNPRVEKKFLCELRTMTEYLNYGVRAQGCKIFVSLCLAVPVGVWWWEGVVLIYEDFFAFKVESFVS